MNVDASVPMATYAAISRPACITPDNATRAREISGAARLGHTCPKIELLRLALGKPRSCASLRRADMPVIPEFRNGYRC